ncbi:TetR family transcriptional regulator [Nocardia puris]|uniref:TetR family transcriptional regulator n=2 Tax=Nocardia puris TaxID=208602 RepID=A0A366E419_9NOCA|nr:TetR family transcriptional regulator [Nocardia puris]
MSAVAEAVNVSPSALYRHFSSKPDLLIAAVVTEMTPFRQVFDSCAQADAGLDVLVDGLVGVAADVRRLGVLWQQEARSLPPGAFAELRAEIRRTLGQLAAIIRAKRPELAAADAELLAASTCSALCGASPRSRDLTRGEFERVFGHIARSVLGAEPATAADEIGAADHLPSARRERLLSAAANLFGARGYDTVSMEEIGAEAGVAGPTIYHHFASKLDLLTAAVERSMEWVWRDLYRALAEAGDHERGTAILRGYLDFVDRHGGYAAILATETRHLPADVGDRIQQSRRDYFGEWLEHIRAQHVAIGEAEARIRLDAVLAVAVDLARTPHLRTRPGAFATVERIADAVLFGPSTAP